MPRCTGRTRFRLHAHRSTLRAVARLGRSTWRSGAAPAAEFVQSDVFHDLVVNGIAPDGTVDWPAAGIVRASARGRRAVGGRRAGHHPPPLAAGSRTGIPSSFQPSTAAAVGGRWCMSAACSSFATVRWRGNGPPGTDLAKHSPATRSHLRASREHIRRIIPRDSRHTQSSGRTNRARMGWRFVDRQPSGRCRCAGDSPIHRESLPWPTNAQNPCN